MNQHEWIKEPLIKYDEKATKFRHVVVALVELERTLALLAFHIDRELTDREAKNELNAYLEKMRLSIHAVELDQ